MVKRYFVRHVMSFVGFLIAHKAIMGFRHYHLRNIQ